MSMLGMDPLSNNPSAAATPLQRPAHPNSPGSVSPQLIPLPPPSPWMQPALGTFRPPSHGTPQQNSARPGAYPGEFTPGSSYTRDPRNASFTGSAGGTSPGLGAMALSGTSPPPGYSARAGGAAATLGGNHPPLEHLLGMLEAEVRGERTALVQQQERNRQLEGELRREQRLRQEDMQQLEELDVRLVKLRALVAEKETALQATRKDKVPGDSPAKKSPAAAPGAPGVVCGNVNGSTVERAAVEGPRPIGSDVASPKPPAGILPHHNDPSAMPTTAPKSYAVVVSSPTTAQAELAMKVAAVADDDDAGMGGFVVSSS